MWIRTNTIVLGLLWLVAGGCGDSGQDPKATTGGGAAQLPEGLLLAEPPAGAPVSIEALKASAKPGDRVTARVAIGGRVAPVVKGVAVMTVVDAGVPNACDSDDDHCPTPWDYCCNDPDELARQTATVRINDAAGEPLAVDVTGAGLAPGRVVVVTATVGDRPSAGALVLHATGIYVEPN